MNRSEFIAAMEAQLIRLPKADRDDILNDYESHFANGIAEGKTEEEVSAQLGDPMELAAVYLENLPEGAKGAPYIPEEEPVREEESSTCAPEAEEAWRSAGNRYTDTQYTNAQYTDAQYTGTQNPEPAKSGDEKDVLGIVATVLLTVFVALPVVWSIAGVIIGAFGITIGCFTAAVALVVLGATSMGLSVAAGVGLILLAVALAALAFLALFLGIMGIKGTVLLVKWYIELCKKMIGGTR